MQTSPQPTHAAAPPNIYQRMHAVMKDVAYVQKEDKKVNGQYRFVTHDAVTSKVREALVKHGIVSVVSVNKHVQDGNRTEVDVGVAFVNVDNPTDRVELQAFGYGIDPQDKGPGKAISYAVKYAYLKAFALETGDDPERDNIDHKPKSHADLDPTRPNTATQHAKDEFELLSPEDQDYCRSHADALTRLHAEGGDLWRYVKMQKFSTEHQLGVWSLLDSKVRSAYKKQKEGYTPPQLAEQA